MPFYLGSDLGLDCRWFRVVGAVQGASGRRSVIGLGRVSHRGRRVNLVVIDEDETRGHVSCQCLHFLL